MRFLTYFIIAVSAYLDNFVEETTKEVIEWLLQKSQRLIEIIDQNWRLDARNRLKILELEFLMLTDTIIDIDTHTNNSLINIFKNKSLL